MQNDNSEFITELTEFVALAAKKFEVTLIGMIEDPLVENQTDIQKETEFYEKTESFIINDRPI